MPKNRIIIGLGVLVALIPIFGFPRLWESIFQVIAGLSIILISIWANIDKRLSLKAKAHKRQIHRHRMAELTNSTEQVSEDESQAGSEKQFLQEGEP